MYGFGYILLLWIGWKQIWWEISPYILHAHSWVPVSLLLIPCSSWEIKAVTKLLKKLSPEEVFKVTGELSVFQDNLVLPVCFCKLLWLPDAT